jgi:phosphatidylinositol 3-kinase
MIEGMGGLNSSNFNNFKILCCKTFNILRRFSNIILLFFKMMTESNIKHLSGDCEINIHKIIEKNLKLDLTDEEANEYMEQLIQSNLKNLIPVVIDKFHTLAQFFKN